MRNNTSSCILEQKLSFFEKLRTQPELHECFEANLNITQNQSGPVSVHKTEETLLEQMRRLSNQSISACATNTEKR